ncbi:MAG: hypothetical protein R3C02_23130 [Planctomycetaceae bacterium]
MGTHYDADSGLVTKRSTTPAGHDEITQTTREYDAQNVTSDLTVVLNHDGHGNVRVLTDLAAVVVQQFVFDAYGQLLAIFNGAGQLQSDDSSTFANASSPRRTCSTAANSSTPASASNTSSRYYNATTTAPSSPRPFFGNLQSPQSFLKCSVRAWRSGEWKRFDWCPGFGWHVVTTTSRVAMFGRSAHMLTYRHEHMPPASAASDVGPALAGRDGGYAFNPFHRPAQPTPT